MYIDVRVHLDTELVDGEFLMVNDLRFEELEFSEDIAEDADRYSMFEMFMQSHEYTEVADKLMEELL